MSPLLNNIKEHNKLKEEYMMQCRMKYYSFKDDEFYNKISEQRWIQLCLTGPLDVIAAFTYVKGETI